MSECPPLPDLTTLQTRFVHGVLFITLHRPEVRNAMSAAMVRELDEVMRAVRDHRSVRALVLRGSGGHFCAGGDIKDMSAARSAPRADGAPDPIAVMNRTFGEMLMALEAAPQATVAVCEGAVMGGGMGLACAVDVTIAVEGATFRLPETSLGVTPAQIAPFLLRRLGRSHARRLAVTGGKIRANEAATMGLAHAYADDGNTLDAILSATLDAIRACEPAAVAATKALLLQLERDPLPAVLDQAAADFATLARSDNAIEGMTAFLQRRPPAWAAIPEDTP